MTTKERELGEVLIIHRLCDRGEGKDPDGKRRNATNRAYKIYTN
jgi:hypothetical protein